MRKLLGLVLVLAMVLTVGMPVMAEGESALELDYAALTRDSIITVSSSDATLVDNLNLPTEGANGSTITWESSDSSVISNEGVVTRPDFTKTVNLTATLNGELSKVFAFRVLGKNEAIVAGHPVPEKGSLIRKDDFNDGVIDANTITVAGNVTEADGKLHLTGDKGVNTSATVYLQADKSPVTGKFIVEYTVTRADYYRGLQIANGPYGYTYWRNYTYDYAAGSADIENESIAIRGGDKWDYFAYDAFGRPSNKLKFTVLYDTKAGTYETWINNRYAGKLAGMSVTDVKSIAFVNVADLSMDCTVDDFACYEAKDSGKVLYKEAFDSSTVPVRVEQKGAAAPTVTNGALQLTSAAAETAANIYLNDGKTPMAGKFAVEFSLVRNSGKDAIDIKFVDGADKATTLLRFYSDGNGALANIASEKDGASAYSSLGTGKTSSINVRAEFDTREETVSFTVNGKTVSGYRTGGNSTISYISFYNYGAANLTLDNFKVISLEEGIENATVIWRDSFSDGVVDNQLTAVGATESNGLLNIPDGSSVKKYFNIGAYGKPITDDFVAEVSLKKITADAQFYFYGQDANGGESQFARVDWREDLNGVAYIFSADGTKSLSGIGTENLHIKLVASVKEQKISVWINGVLVADDIASYKETRNVLYFYAVEGSSNGVGIDEVSFYTIKKEAPAPAPVSEISLDYNAYDKKVCVLSPASGDAMVVAASYKGDTLVDVKLVDIALVENGAALAETALNTTGADKVSVYLWDANGNMIPMCTANNITEIISAN